MAAENAVTSAEISQCKQSFMRIGTHVDAYEPSEDDYRLFIAKLDDLCFC